jgi:hypothetical protein
MSQSAKNELVETTDFNIYNFIYTAHTVINQQARIKGGHKCASTQGPAVLRGPDNPCTCMPWWTVGR